MVQKEVLRIFRPRAKLVTGTNLLATPYVLCSSSILFTLIMDAIYSIEKSALEKLHGMTSQMMELAKATT
jgi:4-hydroxybenzoate polyprenyltransferase